MTIQKRPFGELARVRYDFTVEAEQFRARGLRSMVWGTMIGALLGLAFQLSSPSSPDNAIFTIDGYVLSVTKIAYILICITSIINVGIVMNFINNGRLRAASISYVAGLYILALLAWLPNELTSFLIILFTLPVTVAGVLLTRRDLSYVIGLTIVTVIGCIILDMAGLIDSIVVGVPTPEDTIIFGTIIWVVNGIILGVFAGGQRLMLERNMALTEELKLANKTAQEANRLKSEFLSMMSHELRTPLNATIGFTDLLLTGKPGDLNDKQSLFLKRSADNNRRLKSLIDDVLDLSRIEAGRMELHLQPFSPREMVDHLAASTSSLFSAKNLTFKTTVDANVPQTVVGDRDRIEQVVINLLSNAAKFTEEGTVELKAQVLPDAKWSLSVHDTGAGIAPHMLEMIFEPFRQVDGSTQRQFGGSGLGLAIAQELCRMMESKITVQSEVSKGSVFTVTLPTNQPQLPVESPHTAATRPMQAMEAVG